MAPSWQILFRYDPKKDTYKNVYDRAYRQIKMAQSLSPKSEPALRKALEDAKTHFSSQQKKKPMLVSRVGGRATNKNVASFLTAARRR